MKKSLLYSIILSGCLVISGVVSAAVLGWLTPTGAGSIGQWSTTNPAAGHFTVADEAACNGNVDYVFTNTLNKRDAYNVSLAAIPNGSIINKIEIRPCASSNKNDTPTSTPTFVTMFYKTASGTTLGVPTLLPTSTIPVVLATTTFDGLNLLKNAKLSNLEVGALYSQGNRGVRMSQVEVRITY